MARLLVNDKVGLGEYIINAATNPTARAKLLANPTQELAKFVTYPKKFDAEGKPIQHQIKVTEDTEHVTHIVLPTQDDVQGALDSLDNQGMYPDQYRPGSPDYIDDKEFPKLALQFRFGEYTFGRCKH